MNTPSPTRLQPARHDLIVFDAAVPDAAGLLADVGCAAWALPSDHDPLRSLSLRLAGEPVDTLHLVAHGRAGALNLAGRWIDRSALQQAAALLSQWPVQRIALWSCDTGADSGFVATLERLTGAEVLSADGPLGRTEAGSHWQLHGLARGRGATPTLDGAALFGLRATAAWPHRLGWITVSFAGGFVGTNTGNNSSSPAYSFGEMGWSNVQFAQNASGNLFEEVATAQGNDIVGSVLITDHAGVEHTINGFVKWRAPSGNVSTLVFEPAAATSQALSTDAVGAWVQPSYTITSLKYIGLTFNGLTLSFAEGGAVSGNAATNGLLDELNAYLAAQPALSVGDVSVNEGAGTVDFTVSLSTASADTVTVRYDTADATTTADSDYTSISGGALTFLPGQTSKTVTVSLLDDADSEGAEAFHLVLSDPTFAAISDATGVATLTDNDSVKSLVVGAASGHTTEGGAQATFTVALSAAPSADVTIAVASDDAAEGTAGPATLTFTAANWNAPQTVTVTGADDATVDGNIAYGVNLAASSTDGSYQGLTSSVALTNDDNDSAALTLGAISRHTTEAGQTATFTVRLASQPSANVTVAVASDDAGEGSTDTASLGFTAANWNVPQTVTVTGADDVQIDGAIAYAIDLLASSADAHYQGLSGSVAVTNDDDDAATLVSSAAAGHTAEGGTTTTFTVRLGSQPTGNVTVAVSSNDPGEGTADSPSLGFTPANWNVPQTITVTGADDVQIDGAVAYAIDLLASSVDGDYQGLSGSVSVTNDDDDVAALVTTAALGHTDEGGATTTFTVRLASQPSADVTVAVASSDSDEGTLGPASLTFTPGNWNVAQTVTAAGVDDAAADGAATYLGSLSATSTDADYQGLTGSVGLVNDDDDTAGLTLSTASLDTGEDGGQATFTVRLSSLPSGDVTVAVGSSDATEGSVGPASLTFTPANWSTPQTVTVTGVDDAGIDGDIGYFVNLLAASTDLAFDAASAAVAAVNADDDSAGLVLSGGPVRTTEQGSEATVGVRLSSRPSAPVTVTVASTAPDEGRPLVTTLNFAPDDWNTPQAVTVRGVDDDFVDGSQAYALQFASASADPDYQGLQADVPAANADDDAAGLVLSRTRLHTHEAGGSDSLSVSLSSRPTGPVTVSVVNGDATEGRASPGSFVFTPDDWSVPRTLTVTGVDDTLVDGNLSYAVTLASRSADPAYNELNAGVDVVNDDNDRPALWRSDDAALKTGEDGSGSTFGLRLSNRPTAPVAITLHSSDGSEGLAAPATLTFTPDNWDLPQAVQLQGVDDNLVDGTMPWGLAAVASSADPAYDGLRLDLAVDNADNDAVSDDTRPDFDVVGDTPPVEGDTARLLDPDGAVVASTVVTPEQARTGSVVVTPPSLDDGIYTFMAQVLDPAGQVRSERPITVTIVTDRDGVMPSVESAAHGGDFNADGVADWQQNNVGQLPLRSLAEFQAGRQAPSESFGAVMAGAPATDGGTVQLDAGAQLVGLAVLAATDALPSGYESAGPMLRLAVGSQEGQHWADADPAQAGHQAQVTIDLPFGVGADEVMLWNAASQRWEPALSGGGGGSASQAMVRLIDQNGDGRADRLVMTLTDGGDGDADGLANGSVRIDAMMARRSAEPVFSVLLADGDRFLTTSAAEAAAMAQGTGQRFEGAWFDSLASASGALALHAFNQPFTQDWHWGTGAQDMPYACYLPSQAGQGIQVVPADAALGEEVHLYLDAHGRTQLFPTATAGTLGLQAAGYQDLGTQFRTTGSTAFAFDPEGYLVANRANASVQALVHDLAATQSRTSDPAFVEAVEHHYLTQAVLVGLPHGESADAAAVNLAFGTQFGG